MGETVQAFNSRVSEGHVFVNKYQSGKWAPFTRRITVVQDVPNQDRFVVKDPNGKITTISAHTLMSRYIEPEAI